MRRLSKSNRIKILFTNWIDSYNFNAQSLNVREIASRLNPDFFESTLFYEKNPDPRLLNRPSITLVRIPGRLGTLRMTAEWCRGYDIIFRANLIRFTYIYAMLPKCVRGKCKLVDWIEGPIDDHFEWDGSYLRKRFDLVQRNVDYRVGITQAVSDKARDAHDLIIDEIIPVGVDTNLFTPPERRDNTCHVVLSVGHLITRKRISAVLFAARQFPTAKFIIVGASRGSHHLKLKQLSQKWNLINLTFLDPMPHRDLVQLMRTADILLHPSRVEGFPKVVLEGAATGLPAVICDHYKAPVVLDGVTGFQVHTNSQMIDRLRMLINDRELRLRMGIKAISHAKQFDWDSITRRWEEVFLKVASRGN